MDAVQILYFLDPETRELRDACPSFDQRLVATWGARRGQFCQNWGALSKLDRLGNLAAAVEMVTTRPVAELRFPRRFAVNRDIPSATIIYRVVGRASEALPKPNIHSNAPGFRTLLLQRIRPDSLDGHPVLIWVDQDEITWIHSNEEPVR